MIHVLWSLLVALQMVSPAPPDDLVIRAKKLYIGDGRVLSPAVVVVTGGKISFVGTTMPAGKAGAREVTLDDAVITPGFVESSSNVGLPAGANENEQRTEVTPAIRIGSFIDRRDEGFRRLRSVGVTTVVVSPGNRNVIGGISAALKTKPLDATEPLLKPELALHGVMTIEPAAGNGSPRNGLQSLYARRPNSRMGVVFELRRAFLDGTLRNQSRAPSWTPFDDDEGKVLAAAVRGEMPVEIVAHQEAEILTALHITDEFRIPKFYLQGAVEAVHVRDVLARRNVSVFIGPLYQREQVTVTSATRRGGGMMFGDPQALLTEEGGLLGGPKLLREAGVRFGFSYGQTQPGTTLLDFASEAHRAGLAEGDAIAAISGWPAAILGLGDRLGTLAAGQDADLNVYSGDPLSPASRLELVLVDGSIVFRGADATVRTKE